MKKCILLKNVFFSSCQIEIDIVFGERYVMYASIENGSERLWNVYKDDGNGGLILYGTASSTTGQIDIGNNFFYIGRSDHGNNEYGNFKLSEFAYLQGGLNSTEQDIVQCLHQNWF